jgi:hypothetical protein
LLAKLQRRLVMMYSFEPLCFQMNGSISTVAASLGLGSNHLLSIIETLGEDTPRKHHNQDLEIAHNSEVNTP